MDISSIFSRYFVTAVSYLPSLHSFYLLMQYIEEVIYCGEPGEISSDTQRMIFAPLSFTNIYHSVEGLLNKADLEMLLLSKCL